MIADMRPVAGEAIMTAEDAAKLRGLIWKTVVEKAKELVPGVTPEQISGCFLQNAIVAFAMYGQTLETLLATCEVNWDAIAEEVEREFPETSFRVPCPKDPTH